MLILGIESSCDETAAALVRDGRHLLTNVVASQIEVHNRYGGVVPEVASRQQLASIIPVIEMALEQAACGWEEIDAIAATYGPGLAGSLLVGLTVGKTLALTQNLPFLAVNHLEAHIYANWLHKENPSPSTEESLGDGSMGDPDPRRPQGTQSPRLRPSHHSLPPPPLLGTTVAFPGTLAEKPIRESSPHWEYQQNDPTFPLIALIVSGGHSELVLMRNHGEYELLGRTRDDAAGEAFDKVARILGLGYPGGPAIQHAAQRAEEELQQQGKPATLARTTYRLPRAWLRGTYDFSFSGLKTAMLHLAQGAHQAGAAVEESGEGALAVAHGEGTTVARDSASPARPVSQYTRIGAQAAQTGAINVALLAASFQEAVVDVLAVKTRLAAQEYHVKQVLLAGGVAANTSLRARLEQELQPLKIHLSYPPIEFCTDNAAMIASAAFFHLCQGERHSLDIDVDPGLSLPFRK